MRLAPSAFLRASAVCCIAALLAAPAPAWAQYKNLSLGINGGYDAVTRSSIYSGPEDADIISQPANMPLRLSEGARLGFETNLKMHSDHWWMHAGVNLHLLYVTTRGDPPGASNLRAFDQLAGTAIGTVLGLEPEVGLRYYFLTDRVRPYAQLSLDYMRLITFTNPQGCGTDPTFCDASQTLSYSYLSHKNILSLQPQIGAEFVVRRDLAISIGGTWSHWFIFNSKDNDAFTAALGLTIYG